MPAGVELLVATVSVVEPLPTTWSGANDAVAPARKASHTQGDGPGEPVCSGDRRGVTGSRSLLSRFSTMEWQRARNLTPSRTRGSGLACQPFVVCHGERGEEGAWRRICHVARCSDELVLGLPPANVQE